MLVISAGLMIRSFLHTQGRDPGFITERVLTVRSALRGPDYDAGEQRSAFYRQVIAALAARPGVEAAAASSRPPPNRPVETVQFKIQGTAPELGAEPLALIQVVTPEFFETLKIPLRAGRFFSSHDDAGSEPVAIASSLLVDRFFSSDDPLEQVLERVLELEDEDASRRRIVGVVGDVRTARQPPDPVPTLYIPHAQQPEALMSYIVRTTGDPGPLTPELLRTIADQDPLMPLYRVQTLEETLALIDWQPRFSMRLLGFFAAVALFLAVTGIYAVMVFHIAERRRELVIRTAHGAEPGAVLGLVLRNAIRLVGLGILLGLAGSLAVSQILEAQLHGVRSTDPGTYFSLPVLLGLVALAASALAARRVLAVDPATILREG